MATALVALATTTLASNAYLVTFSSIPQTYRDLRLIVSGNTAGASTSIRLTVNGITSSSYYWVEMASVAGGSSQAMQDTAYNTCSQASMFRPTPSTVLCDIMDYSATDKHKTFLTRSNNVDEATVASVGRVATTSGITTLAVQTLASASYYMAAGTTLSLYGIASS